MKKFTYQQKRWFIATALLAVLAVNVSFNPYKESGSANFASRATEDDQAVVEEEVDVPVFEGSYIKTKVRTRHGMMSVRYLNNGENEVLAVIPKQNTQGQFCRTCGYKTISLTSVENIEDVDALNDALAGIVDKSKIKRTKDEEEVSDEATTRVADSEDNSVDDEDAPEEKSLFDGIVDKCEKDSEKEHEVTSCIKAKYVKILKGKKAQSKEFKAEAALKFYKEEIESRLLKEVAEARRISTRSKFSSLSQTSFISFADSDDFGKKPHAMIVGVANIISELIGQMPKKFESVRHNLLKAENDILKYQALLVKEKTNLALTTKNVREFNEAVITRDSLAEDFNHMQNEFYYRNGDSLHQAWINKNINEELRDKYADALVKSNTEIYNFLSGRNAILNGIALPNTVDLTNRIGLGGRGVGPLQQSAISSRTGVLSNGQTALVPVTVQTTPDGTIIIPSQNTDISFGEVTPITPDAIRMRTRIRGGDYRRQ